MTCRYPFAHTGECGAASAAGIQVGDIILAENNQPTDELSQFYTEIADDQSVVLDIFRSGLSSYVTVQADPSQLPPSSLGVTTELTGGSSEDDDEGYKGMPPVIPPNPKGVEQRNGSTPSGSVLQGDLYRGFHPRLFMFFPFGEGNPPTAKLQ